MDAQWGDVSVSSWAASLRALDLRGALAPGQGLGAGLEGLAYLQELRVGGWVWWQGVFGVRCWGACKPELARPGAPGSPPWPLQPSRSVTQLSGARPLQSLRLQPPQLDDNRLSGTLPPEWGALAGLHTLSLRNNTLSGPLPPGWSGLAGLKYL
jgi:hypothetical protein